MITTNQLLVLVCNDSWWPFIFILRWAKDSGTELLVCDLSSLSSLALRRVATRRCRTQLCESQHKHSSAASAFTGKQEETRRRRQPKASWDYSLKQGHVTWSQRNIGQHRGWSSSQTSRNDVEKHGSPALLALNMLVLRQVGRDSEVSFTFFYTVTWEISRLLHFDVDELFIHCSLFNKVQCLIWLPQCWKPFIVKYHSHQTYWRGSCRPPAHVSPLTNGFLCWLWRNCKL